MMKEIIHDPIFLGVKSEVATKEDLQVARICWIRLLRIKTLVSVWRRI